LLRTKALVGEVLQQCLAGVRLAPQSAQLVFILEEARQLAEQVFDHLIG
jgi:hypothetical protein